MISTRIGVRLSYATRSYFTHITPKRSMSENKQPYIQTGTRISQSEAHTIRACTCVHMRLPKDRPLYITTCLSALPTTICLPLGVKQTPITSAVLSSHACTRPPVYVSSGWLASMYTHTEAGCMSKRICSKKENTIAA